MKVVVEAWLRGPDDSQFRPERFHVQTHVNGILSQGSSTSRGFDQKLGGEASDRLLHHFPGAPSEHREILGAGMQNCKACEFGYGHIRARPSGGKTEICRPSRILVYYSVYSGFDI